MPRVYVFRDDGFALGLALLGALPALFALVALFALLGFFVAVCFAAVFFGGAFFAAVFFLACVALVVFVEDAVCLIASCGTGGGDALAGVDGLAGGACAGAGGADGRAGQNTISASAAVATTAMIPASHTWLTCRERRGAAIVSTSGLTSNVASSRTRGGIRSGSKVEVASANTAGGRGSGGGDTSDGTHGTSGAGTTGSSSEARESSPDSLHARSTLDWYSSAIF